MVDAVLSGFRQKRTLNYFVCLWLALSLPSANLFGSPQLEPQIYMAGLHESEWVFAGSGFSCELHHHIPQFGEAVFRRIAGEALHFYINSFQPIPEKLEVTLQEVSPAWEHSDPDELQQRFVVHTGMQPIRVGRKPAGWLLTSLSKGQVGSFGFLDWDDSRRQVYVRLSPVRFLKPYREFKQCLSQLSGKGFELLKNSTVHFPLDVHILDKRAKQQLDRLVEYVLVDKKISAITVAGHADDQGSRRYNKKLSARRAQSVTRYLISKGVTPALIKQRHYGESRPAVSKRTQQARAANRRAKITLQR